MDYTKIYNQLVVKAKNRGTVEGYKEVHHIVPKCLGGSDANHNKIELTAKEHFIAHLLLTEIYPRSSKLKYALWMMATMETGNQERYRVSSNLYRLIKESISTKTEEHKNGISEGLKRAYAEGRRKTRKGTKMPKWVGKKISASKKGMVSTNKGKKMTDEQKQMRSQTLKNRPYIECPYCKRSSNGVAFKRYHFENCKLKKTI